MEKTKAVIPLVLSPLKAMILVGQIQAALRHPENIGPSANIARQVADEITADLIEVHPNFEQTIAYGWNPDNDNNPAATKNYYRLMNEISEVIDLSL